MMRALDVALQQRHHEGGNSPFGQQKYGYRMFSGRSDREGTDFLRSLLSRISPESEADYVISTIHRSKRLEWDRMRVTGDFRFKTEDDRRTTIVEDEKRLLYVALSRARRLLDVSELRNDLLKVFECSGPNER
jgi:superfamily I DNA/RNA helicase